MLPNCLLEWLGLKGLPGKEKRWSYQNSTEKGSHKGGGKREETLASGAPPTPAKVAPLQAEEIMRRIAQAEQLEGVGRSPSSLPTQQLAQMAAEAGPSTLGKEEPARRKL